MMNQDNIWKQLYQLADEFFALKPWNIMEEREIFAIRTPESNKEYFISIMGAGGDSYSLAAYEGREGIYQFWNIHTSAGTLPPSHLLRIPHMMVSLDEPDFVNPAQMDIMRRLGRDVTQNLLPHFSKLIPGQVPQTPGPQDLKDMQIILEQAMNVVKRASDNKAFIHNQDDHDYDYLFRIKEKDGEQRQWKDEKVRVNPPELAMEFTFNSATLEHFNKAKENKSEVQIDLQFLQTPVNDGNDPAYFPSILLAVDVERGDILFFETLKPFPDYESMLGSLPEMIMQKSLDQNQKLTRFKFRNPDLDPVFQFLSKKTGITATHSDYLDQTDNAFHFMREYMTGGE